MHPGQNPGYAYALNCCILTTFLVVILLDMLHQAYKLSPNSALRSPISFTARFAEGCTCTFLARSMDVAAVQNVRTLELSWSEPCRR